MWTWEIQIDLLYNWSELRVTPYGELLNSTGGNGRRLGTVTQSWELWVPRTVSNTQSQHRCLGFLVSLLLWNLCSLLSLPPTPGATATAIQNPHTHNHTPMGITRSPSWCWGPCCRSHPLGIGAGRSRWLVEGGDRVDRSDNLNYNFILLLLHSSLFSMPGTFQALDNVLVKAVP